MSQEGYMISCWEDYGKCHKDSGLGKGLEGWIDRLRRKIREIPSTENNRSKSAQKLCRNNINVFHNSKKHFHNSMKGVPGNNVRKAWWDHTVGRLICEPESDLHHVDHEMVWKYCVNKGWLESAVRAPLWFFNELEREREPPRNPVGWQWHWAGEWRGRDKSRK